jgi:hypothetical protein
MNRNAFLAAGAVSAIVPAAVAVAGASLPTGPFDRDAFEADLNRPARHRQVFAATWLDQGSVLGSMQNSLDGYAKGYGDGPGTLHVGAVAYGFSLVMFLKEAMWAKYRIREGLGMLPKPDAIRYPPAPPENSYTAQVASLVAAGASFFICDHAFHGVTRTLARLAGFDAAHADAAYDDCLAHLAYGMLVPAGPVALNAAQEAHFTFIQQTL